ncbi:hypothetical protein AB0873_09470 [Micromonospora sp. NPDC047707]|uniref:hypothetical protein n=1 Tax=Micromonospora sp. NPDC047707 TaxID=3154498 RepID=UPI003455F9F1
MTEPATATPTPAPSRNRRLLIAAGAAVAVLIIAAAAYLLGRGTSGTEQTATASATSPTAAATTGRPAAIEVECTNIDRAHNAWEGPSLATTAAEFADFNELDAKMAMDDGKTYLDAVSGYTDQPSKELATAIAQYNYELSLVNVQVVIGDGVSAEQASKTADAVTKVVQSYNAWKAATCG